MWTCHLNVCRGIPAHNAGIEAARNLFLFSKSTFHKFTFLFFSLWALNALHPFSDKSEVGFKAKVGLKSLLACWSRLHSAHSRLDISIMIFPHLFLFSSFLYFVEQYRDETPRNWVEHCCLQRWTLRESCQTLPETSFRNELGEEKASRNSKVFNYNTKETLICAMAT